MNRLVRATTLAASALASARTFAQEKHDLFEETMFSSGKINVVVAVVAVILAGLAAWLFVMDRRVKRMEDRMNK